MFSATKTVGIGAVAFGAGVLATFLLPKSLLILLEAGVITAAGILFSNS